jgi:hypothetical protein
MVCPPKPQRRSSALEQEKYVAYIRKKEEDVF